MMMSVPTSEPRLGDVVYDRGQIAGRVQALGEEMAERHADTVPVLVSVLKGATIFLADLSRALPVQHELDFLALSSYAGGGGQARILNDLTVPITGRHVVLVEDVVDTGLTLGFLLRWLRTREPASLEVCTLLDRPHRRLLDEPLAYRGFTVPDTFLVGYGFDYRQRYRNLADMHELELDPVTVDQLLGA
jgi:hypoxanthine phosphoribosyltransferase